jgi:hypothetical protein
MVRIGIITDTNKQAINIYNAFENISVFSPLLIYTVLSKDYDSIKNKVFISNMSKYLDECYMDKLTVFINLTNQQLSCSNLTFFNLSTIKDDIFYFNNLTLQIKNNQIINSDHLLRELLTKDSSIKIIENNNNAYVFKNSKISEIHTNSTVITNNKNKFNLNINIFANWSSSKDLMSDIKRYCKSFNGDNNYWTFKNKTLNITHSIKKPDYNYVMNGTQESLSTNTIYTCLEPPVDQFFQHYYNNSKKNNITYYGSHEYHQNFVGWHLKLTIQELIESLNKPFIKKYDKILSIVVSDFYKDPGHKARIDFIRELDNRSKNGTLPFDLHIYGRCKNMNFHRYLGELPPAVKDDGLIPYKYHLNAENFSIKNYVTEKFTDAIMSECLIFYWGCPNLEDVYNKDSFVRLTLKKDKYDDEINMISNMINNNEYEKRYKSIIDVKRDMLYNRSLFVKLNNIITLSDTLFYVIAKEFSQDKVDIVKNSCFKAIQALQIANQDSGSLLNIFKHIISQGRDFIFSGNDKIDYYSVYDKISNVCLDTYDVVVIKPSSDNILKETFWMRIDVLEEIFITIVSTYKIDVSTDISKLFSQLVNKFNCKMIL